MFKRGDKVKRVRVNGPHDSVVIGHIYHVWEHQGQHLSLLGIQGKYDPNYFELVTAATGAQGLTPRKHCETIKAWADGAEIQARDKFACSSAWSDWFDAPHPAWTESTEYRVKPTPKPDVEHEAYVFQFQLGGLGFNAFAENSRKNVKFTFDGETGKLKSVVLV